MRAVVVYESMYGNTRSIADAIASGMAPGNDVEVVPVAKAGRELLEGAGLVVVGGPTHVHGMSRPSTRKGAADAAGKPGSQLQLVPGAQGPGLRDWFDSLGQVSASAVAFDTRLAGPVVFTGRASSGIRALLVRHGFTVVAEPESFLVSKENTLRPGQEDRARAWGAQLAAKLAAPATTAWRT